MSRIVDVDERGHSRAATPEHFFRSVEHGLAMVRSGAHIRSLLVMASGAARRGLADAEQGFIHAYLRCLAVEELAQELFEERAQS